MTLDWLKECKISYKNSKEIIENILNLGYNKKHAIDIARIVCKMISESENI
jgi:hypothetical protein